jgi:hypothetical protein
MLLYALCAIVITSYAGNFMYAYYVDKKMENQENMVEMSVYPLQVNDMLLT